MKKEDFYNTKWYCRAWTDEQKIQWQEKCFELGFSWCKEKAVKYINRDYYYLGDDGSITWGESMNDAPNFMTEEFSSMFPEQSEEKLDVVAEIVKLVKESQTVEEVDEDSFEGLDYVAPEVSSYILTDDLSEDQKIFLDNKLKWSDSDRLRFSDYKILNFGTGNYKWCLGFVTGGRVKTSFNNIFQYKED